VCLYDESAGVDCLDLECRTHAASETYCDGIDEDCDDDADDDFQYNTSVENCGACNNDCTTLGWANVSTYFCLGGSCQVKTCSGTTVNADQIASNGCECTAHGDCSSDPFCDDCSGAKYDVDDDCDGLTDEDKDVEICDDLDNDCDGSTDEGLTNPGFCEPLCDAAFVDAATCANGDWTCNYQCGAGQLECAGVPASPDPVTPELRCDGIDGNCDGMADESFFGGATGIGAACSNDVLDPDPVGGCLRYGVYRCSADGTDTVCCDLSKQTSGSVCGAGNSIDMTDRFAHAEPDEQPVPNGIDDDCNGTMDEGADGAIVSSRITYTGASGTKSLPFDIFAYEASRGDATWSDAGSVSTAACSQPLVLPWTYVNFAEARAACQLLNESDCTTSGDGCWDVCNTEQWVYACEDAGGSASDYPYGATYEWDYCNGLEWGLDDTDPDTDSDIVGINLRNTSQMPDCTALWSGLTTLMDMSGNAEEWTSAATVLGTGESLYSIRGGSYNDLGGGMSCVFDFSKADGNYPLYRLENLGFRCCRMDMQCTGDEDCLDNYWCAGSGFCEEANTELHCGNGTTACGDYERCVGSMDGCAFCATDQFCGIDCEFCATGCINRGDGTSVCPECIDSGDCGPSEECNPDTYVCEPISCSPDLSAAGTICSSSPADMADTCGGAAVVGRTVARAGYSGAFQIDNANTTNFNSYCNNDRDEFLRIFMVVGETLNVTATATSNDNIRLGLIRAADYCNAGCNTGLVCVNNTGDWGTEVINYTAQQTGWHSVKISESGGSAMTFNLSLSLTCNHASCDCL